MIASKSFKKVETLKNTTSDPKPHLKPLKRILINRFEKLDCISGQILWERIQTQRIKNPRWVSLSLEIEPDENFENLKTLSKYRSLHLISLEITGMQIGANVGHFNGEIKYLVQKSRHLRQLHFKAGAMLKNRFAEVKHWIGGQKNLKDLSIVPYWYDEKDEEEISEWDSQKTEEVSDLLYKLSAQLKTLTFVGMTKKPFANEFDFSLFTKLQTFCIQAASRCNGCDGDPIEFSKADLKIIEKVLTLKNLKRLVLINEYETTPKRFWITFSKLITRVTQSLTINIENEYRWSESQTCHVLKHHLKMLQSNVKLSYKVSDSEYFLYLPEGKEIIGNKKDFSEDEYDYKEGEEEDDDDDDEDH